MLPLPKVSGSKDVEDFLACQNFSFHCILILLRPTLYETSRRIFRFPNPSLSITIEVTKYILLRVEICSQSGITAFSAHCLLCNYALRQRPRGSHFCSPIGYCPEHCCEEILHLFHNYLRSRIPRELNFQIFEGNCLNFEEKRHLKVAFFIRNPTTI